MGRHRVCPKARPCGYLAGACNARGMLRLSAFTAFVVQASGHGMVRTASPSFATLSSDSIEERSAEHTFIPMTVPPRR